jgi:asparagine synthase (glutamine-hydrolysing)
MCGILAWFDTKLQPIDKDRFNRSLATLHHRGPDEKSTWFRSNHGVALGHTRLAIMDPEGGHQPFCFDSGISAVVNGEFYDFERIRDRLTATGAVFKTKSDSEILPHLYERKGMNILDDLRGEFSFVIWDENSRAMIACRDRFGIKPLYYTWHKGSFIVASEIKALLALGVPSCWDSEMVYATVTNYVLPPDRTMFKNIYQVLPAHYLVVTSSGSRLVPYWDMPYDQQTTIETEADMIEGYQEALYDSVKTRIRSDMPVACYLSGGIDSCAVLGVSSEIAESPVPAFTVSFDNNNYDELPIAKRMAERTGSTITPIPVTESMIRDDFVNAIEKTEYIFPNTHGIAKYILSRSVRDAGYKVVLTGEGSDEFLGGYASFRQDYYRSSDFTQEQRNKLIDALQENNEASKNVNLSEGDVSHTFLENVLGFVPAHWAVHLARGDQIKEVLAEEFREAFCTTDNFKNLFNRLDLRPIANATNLHKSMFLWTKTTLTSYLLNIVADRMEMAHSLEGRVPFLDHKLVEYTCKLPVSMKINGAIEKYVLRESVKDVITEEVYTRQKHPFLAPPSATKHNGPLFEFIEETLRSPQADNVPFFDWSKIRLMLDQLSKYPESVRTSLDPQFTLLASIVHLGETFAMQS